MAFGGTTCPDGYVMRTWRTKVLATRGKQARARELLVAGGDVWAWVIDRFHERERTGLPNANSLTEIWPDQRAHGPFGDLTAHCAQDVTKTWSSAFFEAVRRIKSAEGASLPTRKRPSPAGLSQCRPVVGDLYVDLPRRAHRDDPPGLR
jgi:hypothetical protein